MWSPELVVSVAGFTITFATMLYKFGRLEGHVTTQLEQHELRISRVERKLDRINAHV